MVDRVRSAYASTWLLPELGQVQGQYYFVPENTVPFDSYVWSGNWRDRDKEEPFSLGPIADAPQYWANGVAPAEVCVPPWVISCGDIRVPQRVQVNMGPILDDACSGCVQLGGMQTLQKDPLFCRWLGNTYTFCPDAITGPTTYQLQMVHDPEIPRTTLAYRKQSGIGPTFIFFAQSFTEWFPYFDALEVTTSVFGDGCIDWPAAVSILPAP